MRVGHPSPIWRGAGGEVKKWKGFPFLLHETFKTNLPYLCTLNIQKNGKQ